jgi:hypothetical protein
LGNSIALFGPLLVAQNAFTSSGVIPACADERANKPMIAAINQGPRMRGFIIHNYNTMLSLASIVNIDA